MATEGAATEEAERAVAGMGGAVKVEAEVEAVGKVGAVMEAEARAEAVMAEVAKVAEAMEVAVMEEEDTLLPLTEEVEADEDSLRGSAQAADTAKAATSSPPLSPSLPRSLSPSKPGLQKAKPELDKLQKDVDKLQQDVVGLVRKVQEEVRRPETKTKIDNIVRRVQEEVSKPAAETFNCERLSQKSVLRVLG